MNTTTDILAATEALVAAETAALRAENAALRKALQAYVTQRAQLSGFPQAWEPYSGADVIARSALRGG